MRVRRWSFSVLVAIVAAVAVATGSQHLAAPARHAPAPVQVTLALQSDGASLRITHDALVVTLKF